MWSYFKQYFIFNLHRDLILIIMFFTFKVEKKNRKTEVGELTIQENDQRSTKVFVLIFFPNSWYSHLDFRKNQPRDQIEFPRARVFDIPRLPYISRARLVRAIRRILAFEKGGCFGGRVTIGFPLDLPLLLLFLHRLPTQPLEECCPTWFTASNRHLLLILLLLSVFVPPVLFFL